MERRSAVNVEWPTVAVAIALYGGFGLLTWFHHALAWWLVLPLGTYLVAWHGSLQHEVVHGHPTPWPRLNEALVFPSLWLWLPFRVYRRAHLAHHRTPNLTSPIDDPESFLVPLARWRTASALKRTIMRAWQTLAGRLIAGPFVLVGMLLRSEVSRLRARQPDIACDWAMHLLGCTVVVAWVVGVCGIPLWQYLVLYALPGTSLTLLRSFAEHRAHINPNSRTAVVEAGPLMSLLYLNNNLHVVHHDHPGMPWYRIPAYYHRNRTAILRQNCDFRLAGYGPIIGRHLVRPVQSPAYSLSGPTRVFQAGAAISG